MTNKRPASTSSAGRRGKTAVTTSKRTASREQSGALDPVEEKVVRMRRGVRAPEDMPLERVGQHHPATRAKLQEIEERAMRQSGRLDELRREVGLPVATTDTQKKKKIIERLAAPKARAKKAAPSKKKKR